MDKCFLDRVGDLPDRPSTHEMKLKEWCLNWTHMKITCNAIFRSMVKKIQKEGRSHAISNHVHRKEARSVNWVGQVRTRKLNRTSCG
jgi:hypothetical protein